jgi:asparagine synthase (glutamine-hydrolysing)
MCGITGAVWTDRGTPIDPPTLARMTRVLAHRGPDDEATFREELDWQAYRGTIRGVALGFRRLSIIDVAGSRQPIANEDGSVRVVFNGEIYNFRTLRHRLEGAGHVLRTAGDAETLVHLYEDEGVEFLKRLEGMFALALWDARRRQLVLARDRLGKKPLVYRSEPGRLLFASELKSLLEAPDVPRQVDPQALDEYLGYQYVPHPHTIYRGICKLPPAHFAVYRDGELRLGSYWQPDLKREIRRPAAQDRAKLREKLTSAVRKRLESDVPLGAFLSGGIDSSIVVGLMAQLTGGPVETFSIGFPVADYDETHYARQMAQRLGTIHREFRVEPNAVEILPQLVWHFDEPFADSSAVPTWYVSRLTRQHVTVALTGDGGDELFAGYDRYRAMRWGAWFDRLPRWLRRAATAPSWRHWGHSGAQRSWRRRLRRLAEAIALPQERRYFEWVSIFNERRRAELYSPDFVESLPGADPFDFLAEAFSRARGRDPMTSAGAADLVTYLPCDLLTKVDIASMAHSLECRQPFLDHEVVELAMAIPIGRKMRRGRGKRILIETFRDLLPHSIQTRRKMGFGVPLAQWFRTDLAAMTRDVLLDSQSLARGFFRPETVRRLVEEHLSGRYDHGYRLWSLLVLETWCRRWLPAPVRPAATPAHVGKASDATVSIESS